MKYRILKASNSGIFYVKYKHWYYPPFVWIFVREYVQGVSFDGIWCKKEFSNPKECFAFMKDKKCKQVEKLILVGSGK